MGSAAARAIWNQRSIVLNEKRTASPVDGCFHARAASSSMRALRQPRDAVGASALPETLRHAVKIRVMPSSYPMHGVRLGETHVKAAS